MNYTMSLEFPLNEGQVFESVFEPGLLRIIDWSMFMMTGNINDTVDVHGTVVWRFSP